MDAPLHSSHRPKPFPEVDALESSLRSLLHSEADGDANKAEGQDAPSFFLKPVSSAEEWFRKVLLVEDDQMNAIM